MKVTVDGIEYNVYWQHQKINNLLYSHYTICVITVGLNKEELTDVTTLCHKKDNFCRAVGRKISLTKALRKAFPSFEGQKMRTAFWKAYSEQIGFKKNKKGQQ